MNRKLIIHIMIILTLLVAVSCIFTPYALKKYRKYCAVKAYHEFIEGKRDCMGQDILSLATPTGEPNGVMPQSIL